MRNAFLLAVAAIGFTATAAQAQESTTSSNGTSFRGIRIEANAGGDRFQSQGNHNDKFGYGGTIGFDGQIGERIVIGAEGSYWRANDWSENCTRGTVGGSVCHKSFDEYGAAVRAGVLATPQLLIFAKGGYVTNEQRKRFDAPAGQTSYYNHFNTDGYQVGGGVEYSLTGEQTRMPLYVNAQYVYSQYNDHTARQRVMAGVGLRFK
ncbi:outer membrane protein [Sphingomonas sp. R1]|uniref:outer membrane protein n=1 Tax=Sphingomonas sp. R1 TaxID=399176 RepID=UPI0022248672|nr:porin family protein [Sphingomonas sp. R1]UYY77003.1 porin family protein [Sphingomonas sp. R1]